ncbi:phosphopantetheine adenylyltransferase [Labrenzia sp. 011]|uniref:phosphopantetheine adenylyltransferase n=1 Tax=Labrenzia sp. 011 TaxID=2171494 RepID=UPI000D50D2E2|nr:phosphopantetheine adenylyltransferase [Labrenzia sp. 011]PVB63732.1 phosphopantetheine adenylyltransferase [Labrenzia sp. 011]
MKGHDTNDPGGNETTFQPFSIAVNATDPAAHFKVAMVFVLALLTMIAAGAITMHPGNASQAEDLTSVATQGMMATKTDRIASAALDTDCKSQTWGAWSEDCLAALTGADKVRNVSFITVEKTDETVNETILARYPAAN